MKFIVYMLGICSCLTLFGVESSNKLVKETKRIYLKEFPGAFNPSIIKFGDNYLLTFRDTPFVHSEPWVSQIGVVLLDGSFEPISEAQLLDTRFCLNPVSPQSEDGRIFSCNGRLYIVYNDNTDVLFPSYIDRRDMYIAEIFYNGKVFYLSDPVKLVHEEKYDEVLWQKNWSPFVWNEKLLFSYTINPHEVLSADLNSGLCKVSYETIKNIQWQLGDLRGGSPAELVDGEYLAFFHSSIYQTSLASCNQKMWHYYMGAYTFNPNPPFDVTSISHEPLNAPSFYTYSNYYKRVIYPGGFVVEGPNIYIAYGKDDSEIWVATLDLNQLKKSMVPLNHE